MRIINKPKPFLMKNSFLFIAVLSGLSVIFSLSCGKKSEDSPSPDSGKEISNSKNVSESDNQIQDVYGTASDAFDGKVDGRGGRTCECGTVTHNEATKTVTVDFGTGCTGPFGQTHKGKIIIVYVGASREAATERQISFDNYFMNQYGFSGKITANNFSFDLAKGFSYTLSATNLLITDAQKGTKTTISSAKRDVKYDFAGTTNNPTDDVVTVKCSLAGTTSEGNSFTASTEADLSYKISCLMTKVPYPSSGKYLIKVNSMPDITVDFGSGSCDKTINISFAGKTYTETLP